MDWTEYRESDLPLVMGMRISCNPMLAQEQLILHFCMR